MKTTILTACLLAFLFAFSIQTFAIDFTVNQITDEHDATLIDGICDVNFTTAEPECTLRAAIEQANNFASNDRVLFNLPPNSIITLTTANGGEIPINNNGILEIVGTGANNLTVDGGAGTNRIFYANNSILTISGVTLTGGNGLSVNMNGFGGAIFARVGSLTLDRVHVTGNTANTSAGGVYFQQGGTHRITNSTFSGNTARSCGGFASAGGTLLVVNSTISGNVAASSDGAGGGSGGGFCDVGATTTMRNVTITNNTAINGGGIYLTGGIVQSQGTLNLGNTIVAGNNASGSFPEIQFTGGMIISAGGNLIGDSLDDSANTQTAINYQPTDIRDANPMLGALQNNGGTTPTHALLTRSPIIDRGLNALAVDPFNGITLSFDQRGAGFPRFRDGNGDGTETVDIGAFEAQLGTTAASVLVGGRVTTAKGRGIGRARVTLTDSSGETRTALTNTLGFYSFADVAAGETYIFNVSHKRYSFNQIAQVQTIAEEITDMDFVVDN